MLTIAFPNQRTLTLPIVGRIVKPVIVKPDSLSFGIVQDGAIPSIKFTLFSKSQIKVLDIQAPTYLKVVEVSSVMHADANKADVVKQFEISLNASESPTQLREGIKIKTSISPEPILIPVYGYIQTVHPTIPSSQQNEDE